MNLELRLMAIENDFDYTTDEADLQFQGPIMEVIEP